MQINAFLFTVKKDYNSIIAAVPEKLIPFINAADEFITCSNQWFDARKANYPDVLEVIEGTRERSNFNELAINHFKELNKTYPGDIVQFYWDKAVLLHDGKEEPFFPDYGSKDLGTSIRKGLECLLNQVNNNLLLFPTVKSYQASVEKYGHLFKKEEKNYLVFTRNFSKKQNDQNSINWCPNLMQLVEYLNIKGINLIGLGFPSLHFPNIPIINNPASHGIVLGLFYQSDGVMCFEPTIASVCLSSNVDVIDVFGYSAFNLPVKDNPTEKPIHRSGIEKIHPLVVQNKFEEVFTILSDRKTISDKNLFSEEKKTIYLANE